MLFGLILLTLAAMGWYALVNKAIHIYDGYYKAVHARDNKSEAVQVVPTSDSSFDTVHVPRGIREIVRTVPT